MTFLHVLSPYCAHTPARYTSMAKTCSCSYITTTLPLWSVNTQLNNSTFVFITLHITLRLGPFSCYIARAFTVFSQHINLKGFSVFCSHFHSVFYWVIWHIFVHLYLWFSPFLLHMATLPSILLFHSVLHSDGYDPLHFLTQPFVLFLFFFNITIFLPSILLLHSLL